MIPLLDPKILHNEVTNIFRKRTWADEVYMADAQLDVCEIVTKLEFEGIYCQWKLQSGLI